MVPRRSLVVLTGAVLMLCIGSQYAAADSVRAAPPLASRSVSPADLKKLTNFTNTVLLTLYIPSLPRWKNFSQVVEETHFFFANSTAPVARNVHIVRGDCTAFPTFKRTFGLRAFPSLVLYPSGMASSAYFRIPFEDDNTTAHTLIDTVLDYVHRTETQLPFLSSFSTHVHAAISQLDDRDLAISIRRRELIKELELAQLAADEAARNATANGTADSNATMATQEAGASSGSVALPEASSAASPDPALEPTPEPEPVPVLSLADLEGEMGGAPDDTGSPRVVADTGAPPPVTAVDIAVDGSLGAARGVDNNSTSPPDAAGNTTGASAVPAPPAAPVAEVVDMSPDGIAAREVAALILESKAQFQPFVRQAALAVKELRIQLQKAEFYHKVLEAVQLEGSGIVARWLNPRLHRLIDEHNTIDPEERATLLLEVGVLNHFLAQRF